MARAKPGSGIAQQLVHWFHRWTWLLFLLVIALFGGYIILSRDTGLLQVMHLKQERDQLQQEVIRLRSEKESLESQLKHLEKVDPMTIEEEARRKGMVREGEEVYRLKYKEVPDSVGGAPAPGKREGQ